MHCCLNSRPPYEADAIKKRAKIADVERGHVAVEAGIGKRTKPSDRGGVIGSSFRRSADLAAPKGRVIGGEVAVRDPEIPLQLDGIARSQRYHGL